MYATTMLKVAVYANISGLSFVCTQHCVDSHCLTSLRTSEGSHKEGLREETPTMSALELTHRAVSRTPSMRFFSPPLLFSSVVRPIAFTMLTPSSNTNEKLTIPYETHSSNAFATRDDLLSVLSDSSSNSSDR